MNEIVERLKDVRADLESLLTLPEWRTFEDMLDEFLVSERNYLEHVKNWDEYLERLGGIRMICRIHDLPHEKATEISEKLEREQGA